MQMSPGVKTSGFEFACFQVEHVNRETSALYYWLALTTAVLHTSEPRPISTKPFAYCALIQNDNNNNLWLTAPKGATPVN